MNPSDVIFGAFIGVGGAIIGALITGILAYCSGKRLIQKTHENDLEILYKTEFNKASAEFQSAFVKAIRVLEDPTQKLDATFTQNVFLGNIERHTEAYILFRYRLGDKRRTELDDAWNTYNDRWSDYFSGGNVDKQKEDRKVLLERIKNLISFAS